MTSASGSKPISRRTSSAGPHLDPSSAAGSVGLSLTSPLASPSPNPHVGLPSSPPPEGDNDVLDVNEKDKEFEELVENLRGALKPRGGKGKVWLGEGERRDFRIVLVDKVS